MRCRWDCVLQDFSAGIGDEKRSGVCLYSEITSRREVIERDIRQIDMEVQIKAHKLAKTSPVYQVKYVIIMS
jgi:hypothetical protein